jgi:hypothetical protein
MSTQRPMKKTNKLRTIATSVRYIFHSSRCESDDTFEFRESDATYRDGYGLRGLDDEDEEEDNASVQLSQSLDQQSDSVIVKSRSLDNIPSMRKPFYGTVISTDQFWKQCSNKTTFTLVICFRGAWSGSCQYFLETVNQLLGRVSSLGGQMVGLCSQDSIMCDNLIKQCNLQFSVCSDVKNDIGTKYQMKISEKSSEEYECIVKQITDYRSEQLTGDDCYAHGMLQPGIMVLTCDGALVYRWNGDILHRNGYGRQSWIPLQQISEALELLFDSNYVDIPILSASDHDFLNAILANSHAKNSFKYFLESEQTLFLLEFLEVLEQMKENPIHNYESIYDQYLKKEGEKELGVPLSLITLWDKIAMDQSGTDREVSDIESMINYIKQILITGSLKRFLVSFEIIRITKILPECFE